jgi:hypothetical protein
MENPIGSRKKTKKTFENETKKKLKKERKNPVNSGESFKLVTH